MANMSMVLDVGEPTYERGVVAPPTGTPNNQLIPPATKTSQVSPSRQLKMTPTHIGDEEGDASIGGTSLAVRTVDPSNVLSPPRQERERALNNAETDPAQKIARTVSAPPNSGSLKKEGASQVANPLRGSSTGGAGVGKRDVTDVLRQLVEQGEVAHVPKSRAVSRYHEHV